MIHLNGIFNAENLVVENLSFPNIAEYSLYSGINLINSKNIIKNTLIANSSSEDAINIIDSESYIDELLIKNALSDGIDVDSGKLTFGKISCENIANDCLDVSGVKINGNLLVVKNAGDKGFSAGEKTFGSIKKIHVFR